MTTSQTNTPDLMNPIPPGSDPRRDAVHVAIAPVVAGEKLYPGDPVGLYGGKAFDNVGEPIGIVNPFLANPVLGGETFYLFLYPNTVTSLRHTWTHPAFMAVTPKEKDHA